MEMVLGMEKRKLLQTRPYLVQLIFMEIAKWRADKGVRNLQTDDFHVAVLRPPMIYGKGSKGNYSTLEKLARTLPIFPDVNNRRSMLYIDNLCEFLYQLILSGKRRYLFSAESRVYKNIRDGENNSRRIGT